MKLPPDYFEHVRQNSENRWIQLENDPELAGPWHQLFKQVQSPRHIVSELLQNADDAGATEAIVSITDNKLIFEHNGEDFTEEQFISLCRFGFSNKRSLHTIGFRGIGFKSTFSLGNTVELYTPTLSVAFDRKRFTQPRWIDCKNSTNSTRVEVPIIDLNRQRELEKNLEEWKHSALSLLFFHNIRRLKIGKQDLIWKNCGKGPMPNTEWMQLGENPESRYLLIKSGEESFPREALEEIKQERLISEDQEADFPPCKVELVLGAEGRLYVVLPTGVKTDLPFACNAPFIQDPARLKIKDPEISPTNRWLLERVGKMAAKTMLYWLNDQKQATGFRARAYDLMPDVNRTDNSLNGVCASIAELSFDSFVDGHPFILLESGKLAKANESILLPSEISDIWSPQEAARFFDSHNRPPLSTSIIDSNKQKLLSWGLIEEIDQDKIIDVLVQNHLPKPSTWRKLLKLWSYLSGKLTQYYSWNWNKKDVRIIPVQGQEILYSTNEVVRLSEKRLLKSDSDWEFLSKYLLVMNPNWTNYLAEKRRDLDNLMDETMAADINSAFNILNKLELDVSSDLDNVIETVASSIFIEDVPLTDCIRFTQITAALNAKAGDSFLFSSIDLSLHDGHLVVDSNGIIKDFFPDAWRRKYFLHEDYFKNYTSCSKDEWLNWINSGKSNLFGFAPLRKKESPIFGKSQIRELVTQRECSETPIFPYVTNNFKVEDWDFDETLWHHWNNLAKKDSSVWGEICEIILSQPNNYWNKATNAQINQIATTGGKQLVMRGPLVSNWINKLKELPCLPDTHGICRIPKDLMMRTPETEAFRDVEPFIKAELDTEKNRTLLRLLGVREAPVGPKGLLERLRALSGTTKPLFYEVEKWYRRLDQLLNNCSTEDFEIVKTTFQTEKIILTENGIWENLSGVFLNPDEIDAPGSEVIFSAVRELSLWRRLDIAERPTVDLAIKWLNELPSGKNLSQEQVRRVKNLLGRHGKTIWETCGHWLNMEGGWVPTRELDYSISMQSLVKYGHLDSWVKRATADFQNLDAVQAISPPFDFCDPLSEKIENRPNKLLGVNQKGERKKWLVSLGKNLQRIKLDDERETLRTRKLGFELTNTVWKTVSELKVIPYIDDTPAGLPTPAEVLWQDQVLFVENKGIAKIARSVSQELTNKFRRPELIDAIKMCFDRAERFVNEYMEENFDLIDEKLIKPEFDDESSEDSSPILTDEFEDSDPEEIFDEDEGASSDVDDSESQETEDSSLEDILNKERKERVKRPTVSQPGLMERFAISQGFKKDSSERFFHPNGSWIGKNIDGSGYQWERRAKNGELLKYYWVKDHCLMNEPLEIEASIFLSIKDHPNSHALLLANQAGEPEEYSGNSFKKLLSEQQIRSFPATYRLQYFES